VTKTRLEAFSDGVFAIAITLLVIEIRPPEVHEGERLAHALWAQWPSYVAYLVSFLTIGVIWLNHHRIFEQVARVDGPLLLLNLNLLLWTQGPGKVAIRPHWSDDPDCGRRHATGSGPGARIQPQTRSGIWYTSRRGGAVGRAHSLRHLLSWAHRRNSLPSPVELIQE
jgi:hypothetical protein